MAELDELVLEFLAEAKEMLDALDRDLVALEAQPDDRELLARIFRAAHSIKGTCGFLDFRNLEGVTHAGESLLSRMRDGELALNGEITSALLAMVDAIRVMVGHVEQTGRDGDDDFAALRAQLAAALAGESPAPPAAATPPEASAAEPAPAPSDAPKKPSAPSASAAVRPAGEEAPAQRDEAAESLRVAVALIDRLMNQVGELVLVRNELLQHSRRSSDVAQAASTQRLNLITSELQEGVMRMRMQPIDAVFSKLPRVVRDLARGLGKRVRLEMSGRKTELDKTLIEAIKDPLTHLLRNAIDHGVETPERRAAAGKPEEGCVRLSAAHESGRVTVSISDDGAGIDPEKLKAKAIQKGLLSPHDAERLGEREVLELVFLPGFSTAESVSNVSGRGVGMDVVKTNVERLGGQVEIDSEIGRGTSFHIHIPLTLAIVPALIVVSGGERYAVPQANLVEVVRVDGRDESERVESLGGAAVFRLRGQLLPLVYLHQVLGLRAPAAASTANIAVLQCEGQRFGLVVDRVIDSQEIVVKPLGTKMKNIAEFSGATILGDGQVALILDVPGLAARSRAITGRGRDAEREAAETQEARTGERVERLLLVARPDGGRMLIPLDHVARLESVRRDALEHKAGRDVIQYRGEILPLVWIDDVLPERRATPRVEPRELDSLSVVVVRGERGQIGLVIGEILDVIEHPVVLERRVSREGVLGSLVIDSQVTEYLDMPSVLRHSGLETPEVELGGVPS